MGRHLDSDVSDKISEVMFSSFGQTEAELFLRKELERYIPQFAGWDALDIRDFIDYQRSVWLNSRIPELGKPIASLNPTFTESVKKIDISGYTRVSVKENGYRFQLHNNANNSKAYTRQFTPYDLKMFPELTDEIDKLPVMIGDAELINKKHPHLAGFNKVQERIPDARYWPKKGQHSLDDALLKEYFSRPLFKNGYPVDDFTLTLAFHGIFAIADPETWSKPKDKQLASLSSFCSLPMNYERVDELLDELNRYIKENEIDARVVERVVVKDTDELENYVAEKERQNLEGVVIVQYSPEKFSKSIKIKKYETIDTVLLGVDFSDQGLKSAYLGLYDESFECYLPVCKVNLDPAGVQIKTADQRARLEKLNSELLVLLKNKKSNNKLTTLYDVYLMEAKIKLGIYEMPDVVEKMFEEFPRGQNFQVLMEKYNSAKEDYNSGKKKSTKTDQWIYNYKDVLSVFSSLEKKKYSSLMKYLSKASEIKSVSKRLDQPDVIVDTTEPIIIETQVFDIKRRINPYAAGFHSWYGNSFYFNNCFADHVRYDKSTTTDYETVHDIAHSNSGRSKRGVRARVAQRPQSS